MRAGTNNHFLLLRQHWLCFPVSWATPLVRVQSFAAQCPGFPRHTPAPEEKQNGNHMKQYETTTWIPSIWNHCGHSQRFSKLSAHLKIFLNMPHASQRCFMHLRWSQCHCYVEWQQTARIWTGLVVIHALRSQAFDQPGKESGNLQELSTSLLRHQVLRCR